ncbi:alpha/beta hydrolase [Halobacillus sp. ACCC02827]|uniref:alpha/beta hydrolase n=1 Tax=Bacillaceae TaxID=186817 RepID=UPI0004139A26|nr:MULTISPECIES: alpha/beta hydrolase [Bacillaceae]QHT47475.1 alpha/beta hydrolase [Bacillus sp. SB49]WJE14702.1 alpha/beta hydrolase [Halobacillus sp. ACCC02827]
MNKKQSPASDGTIIIVHGAFEHGGRYERLADRLHKDGFDVIYGDLPGQGNSPGRKGHIHSFEEYIKTVEGWIGEADPDKKIFLLGHSMGGLVTVRVMEQLQQKMDGIILSSPALAIKGSVSAPVEWLSYLLNIIAPSLRMDANQDPSLITRDTVKVEQFRKDPLVLKKVSVRWYREFQRASRLAFRDVNQFPDVPLLVLQAGRDELVVAEKTAEWFHIVDAKEKTYKEWPELYHELFNEPEWEDVYLYTLGFLQQQLKK